MDKQTQQAEFERLVQGGMDPFKAADLVTGAAAEVTAQVDAGRSLGAAINRQRQQTPKPEAK